VSARSFFSVVVLPSFEPCLTGASGELGSATAKLLAYENGLSYDDQMENEVAKIPLRRHAKPQEVAQTIKFLITEQSDFIDGINLILDGGFTSSY
ncbi:MAG: SDR family oxidoreductase, partial [Parachlamydiaceae bacterium]